MFKVVLSKKSNAFLDKNKKFIDKVIESLKKFVNYLSGERENIDIKKMKGDWQDYYRLNVGRIRIVFSVDVSKEEIYVERIGFRGDIYKK